MTNISFEIKKTIAVLSKGAKGWQKELNLISWNGRAPKYDIRDWSADHSKMGKGVTLSDEELKALLNAFSQDHTDKNDKKTDNEIHDYIKSLKQQSPIFFTELRNLFLFASENGLEHHDVCKLIAELSSNEGELTRNDLDQHTILNALNNELHMLKMIYSDLYQGFCEFLKGNEDSFSRICETILEK